MKKSLSLVLSLVMIIATLTALPFSAMATVLDANTDSDGFCNESNSVSYHFDSASKTLTISGSGAMTDYAETESPFNMATFVKSIVIENGVTHIGSYAFRLCANKDLTSISIPNSVTSIGERAFTNCYYLNSVIIPASISTIEASTFNSCVRLEQIYIPKSVTTVKQGAFSGCSALKDVFYGGKATDWTAALITTDNDKVNPAVEGHAALHFDCCALSGKFGDAIYYDLNLESGLLTLSGTGEMQFCYNTGSQFQNFGNAIKNVVIQDGITEVGEYVFKNCIGIETVSIPDSVTIIDDCAFEGCHALVSAPIPDSVTIIDDWAFEGCHALVSAPIPDSVRMIGMYAFDGCNSLTDIHIPSGVTYIGMSAFEGTPQHTAWQADDSSQVFYIDNHLLQAKDTIAGNYTVQEGTLMIANFAFYSCPILTGVTIPASVVSIGEDAFGGCSALTTLNILDSAVSIGNNAFANCDHLTNINLGNNVTRIIGGAFTNTPADLDYEMDPEAQALYISNYLIKVHPFLTGAYTVKEGTLGIADHAFDNRDKLTSVTTPNSLKFIGFQAFNECEQLQTVVLGNSVNTIDYGAFAYCPMLTSLNIPDSVTYMHETALEASYAGEDFVLTASCHQEALALKIIEGTERKWKRVHDYVGTVATAPTCTTAGVMTFACVCGNKDKAPETIAPLGHDFSNNAEYCRHNCGTKNDAYVAPVNTDTATPVTPVPTPTATVEKKKNTLSVKGKTVTLKAKNVRKKAQTVTAKKAMTVSKQQGKVTYKKSSGNKNITVAKNGKITVKKGLKKGTYKVKIKVTAAGSATYKSGSKTVTVTIKIK